MICVTMVNFQNLKHRLYRSPTFWQSLANYLEKAWALGITVILARLILPENFGTFAFGSSIAFIVVFLCRWEIGSLVRADKYYREEGFSEIWGLTTYLVWMELLFITLASVFTALLFNQMDVALVVFVYGIGAALDRYALILKCDLEGRGEFKQNFLVRCLHPPINLLVVLPMALAGLGLTSLLSGTVVGVIVNWYVMRRYNKRKIPTGKADIELLKKLIKRSMWLWMNQLAGILLDRVDRVLLGSATNERSVAAYNRAYNFTPLSLMVLGGFVGSPAVVAIALADGNHKEQWRIYIKRCVIVAVAGVAVGIGWLMFSDTLVPLIFGEKWLYAIPTFKAFAFFGAIQGIYLMSHALLSGCTDYRALATLKFVGILVAIIALMIVGISPITLAYSVMAAMLTTSVLCSARFLYQVHKR